jgi:hypothetical protein
VTRFASVGRDQGIAIHEQELREWQERITPGAGKKMAAAIPAGDFIADALALFDPPPKPDGEAT